MSVRTRLLHVLLFSASLLAFVASHESLATAQVRPASIVSSLGRCLDVSAADPNNGASIQLYDCNGTAAQQWFIEGTRIRSVLGRCLDVASGNSGNGASLQLYDCNGTPAQTWTVARSGPIVSALGRCLDVSWGNPSKGSLDPALRLQRDRRADLDPALRPGTGARPSGVSAAQRRPAVDW